MAKRSASAVLEYFTMFQDRLEIAKCNICSVTLSIFLIIVKQEKDAFPYSNLRSTEKMFLYKFIMYFNLFFEWKMHSKYKWILLYVEIILYFCNLYDR